MRYAGRVIDGPWEGKQYAHESYCFPIAYMPPMYVTAYDPNKEPDCSVVSHRAWYIWSRGLRGWCFDWGTHG